MGDIDGMLNISRYILYESKIVREDERSFGHGGWKSDYPTASFFTKHKDLSLKSAPSEIVHPANTLDGRNPKKPPVGCMVLTA